MSPIISNKLVVSLKEPLQRCRILIVSGLVIFSFMFKIFFLFHGSNYTNHLISDMGAYWARAQQRYDGNIFDIFQWMLTAPFFHLFLFQLFKIAAFLGFYSYRLEFTLFIFIFLSSLSVIGVYQIASKMLNHFWLSFAAAAFYAFCFPIIYFNTLVMSENLSIPLLIAVTWIMFVHDDSVGRMFFAGLLFGLTVGVRPILGILGLAYLLYILLSRGLSRRSVIRSFFFGFGFFLIIFLLITENFYISKGQIRKLAGGAALSLFTNFCKPHSLISNYSGYGGVAILNSPLFFERHFEYGDFYTDRPFHDEAFFIKMTQKCIQENPTIWLENLKTLSAFFDAPFFPSFTDFKGFSFWMPLYNSLALFLTVSVGLFYIVAPRDQLFLLRMTVLLSPLFSLLLIGYFFVPERRFLIQCWPGLSIVFFGSLQQLFCFRKKAIYYYALVVLVFCIFLVKDIWIKTTWQKDFHVQKLFEVSLEKVLRRYPNGTIGTQMGMCIFPIRESAFLLKAKKPCKAKIIEIGVNSGNSYVLEFFLKKNQIAKLRIPAILTTKNGIQNRVLDVTDILNEKSFDSVLIRCGEGPGPFSIAYFIVK